MKTQIKKVNEEYNFRAGSIIPSDLNLIKKYHYSKRPVSNVIVSGSFRKKQGMFGLTGQADALCLFCNPVSKWSEPVLELLRLVRIDGYHGPNLSQLISLTCKYIKENNIVDLLVSYADSSFNHHGGIYQACSWFYHGKRKRSIDGLVINGKFFPGRSCVPKFGTRSASKLKLKRPDWHIFPHYDEGKHLYWKPINKKGSQKAISLGLLKNAYPKPEEEENYGR